LRQTLLIVLVLIAVGGLVTWQVVAQPADEAPADAAVEGEAAAAPDTAPAENWPEGLETEMQRVSYAIGMMMGGQMKASEVDIQPDSLAAGLGAVLNDAEPKLTQQQAGEVLAAFERKMMAEQMKAREEAMANARAEAEAAAEGGADPAAEQAKAAEDNLKAGQAFLEANKQKEGVQTTESGLQYRVIAEGEGEPAAAGDGVTVHYTGTLTDGTIFDSSARRTEPFSFRVPGNVIPGWNEAVRLMKPGAKYRFFIPSDLAYADNPPPGSPIGPNDVLVFDIELLHVSRSADMQANLTAATQPVE